MGRALSSIRVVFVNRRPDSVLSTDTTAESWWQTKRSPGWVMFRRVGYDRAPHRLGPFDLLHIFEEVYIPTEQVARIVYHYDGPEQQ